MMMVGKGLWISVVLAVMVAGCTTDQPAADTFDRKAMLTGMADKLIIPGYKALLDNTRLLEQQAQNLPASVDAATVDLMRATLRQTMLLWQDVVAFDFGPAEGLYGNLSVNVGTFPCSAQKIEQAIANGDTTQQDFNRDKRGIYAVEYLLFHAASQEVAAELSGTGGQNRRNYLSRIAHLLRQQVETVYQAWTTGYRTEFLAKDGTDAGSSTTILFNAMNIGYELIKNYKLGIPLGLRAGQAGPEPTRVEAYYSGMSMELIRRQYDAIFRIWSGTDYQGVSFNGFEEYALSAVNGSQLVAGTHSQADSVLKAFAAIPPTMPLSIMVTDNPQPPTALQTELQKLTRFFKSELSSLLGIYITYSSGDGD